jgi:hypothetical protein
METMEPRELLVVTNPNKAWVVNKLDALLTEWEQWLETVQHLPDSPDYNKWGGTEAIKDGFANRRLHDVLRDKTLVFIGNHFSGYGFLFEYWPSFPHENNTVRLRNPGFPTGVSSFQRRSPLTSRPFQHILTIIIKMDNR